MISRKTIAAALAVVIAARIVSTVFADMLSKLPPLSTQQGLTYAKDIQPIFKANCFPCHGPTTQRRRLRLDSLESVLKGCEDGPVIFPGKSDQGDLILETSGIGDHDMPPWPANPPLLSRAPRTNTPPLLTPEGFPQPKPLTAEQIGLIRAWVAQGAN
jgi:hypothetical protein